MKDYLHNPDDYAHLSADCPPCGDCRWYDPAWTSGMAAHGRVYKSKLREGECTRYNLIVREGTRVDDICFERR